MTRPTPPTTQITDLAFEVQSSGTIGSLIVTLWSDSSNTPAAPIATLATLPISAITNTFGLNTQGVVDIANAAFVTGNSLAAGTTYWIGFQQSGVTAQQGSLTKLDVTQTAVTGPTEANPTSVILGGNFAEMCVSNDETCNRLLSSTDLGLTSLTVLTAQAPEPASLAILGSAMTGLGLLRRRRARKAAKA